MSLSEHLVEFRKRLVFSVIAVFVGAVAGWFVSENVLAALKQPVTAIIDAQGRTASLNFTNISGAFDLRLQIAFTIGAVVSSPFWLYQVWAFLLPGLLRHEKRYALGFFLAAVPLFFCGCLAGWFVLPNIVALLTGFAPTDTTAVIDAKPYYDFVVKLVLAIGIAFVLPVFLVLLNFVGTLSARTIFKSWRIALIAIVLFTAIATPAADVLSMFFLAIPMIFLYYVAAFIAWLHDRYRARAEKNLLKEGVPS